MHPEAIRALTGYRTPEMLAVYKDFDPASALEESINRIQKWMTDLVLPSPERIAD